jgi:hypothetical protein
MTDEGTNGRSSMNSSAQPSDTKRWQLVSYIQIAESSNEHNKSSRLNEA